MAVQVDAAQRLVGPARKRAVDAGAALLLRGRRAAGCRPDAAPVFAFLLEILALVIRRALLIATPASRRGLRPLGKVTRAFERAGVVCDVVLTERPGHAAEIAAARHADYDAVFSL